MPRRYTDEEKHLVLDRLIANHGDISRTVSETGISDRTLLRWRTENDIKPPSHGFMSSPTTTTSPTQNGSSPPSPVATGEGLGLGVSGVTSLPTETTEAFQTLHDKLLAVTEILANRIVEAIDDAPLNQRTTALSQLIDRIAKLAALLPEPDDEPEPSGKPFEIDYDVEEKDDEDEEEDQEFRSPAISASQSEEDSRKCSPF